MFVAALVVASTANVGASEDNPLRDYLFCATRQAVSLIASGETADIVAGVAQRSCEPLISAAADWDDEQSHADPVMAKYEAQYGRQNFDREDALRQLRQSARDAATSAVVEFEAKNKHQK